MSETNPYAPPTVTEPEASSTLYWQTDGAGVLARNGAMLPKVDLETGVADGEMTAVSRNYQAAGVGQVFRILLLIAVFALAKSVFDIDEDWLLWGLIGGSVLLSWLMQLRGKHRGTITIWEFREAARERRRKLRGKWRAGLLFLSFFLMVAGPTLLVNTGPFHSQWGLRLVSCGMGLFVANVIWSMMDRRKSRLTAGPPGWLRITRVDPQALAELAGLEAEERAKAASDAAPRKRLVFTSYYHKYPLAALLGSRRKNPLSVILIALMKLLRSKRLERESFHFTEAREIHEEDAHEKLRERIQSWRAAHPDWSILLMEQLPSPAGDLMLQSAIMTSPDLAHALCLHHSWLEQKPASGTGEFLFLTWLADGKLASTTHMALLPIHRPNVDTVKVSGTEEEVFRAHLARCPYGKIDAAVSPEHLLERYLHEKEEISRLLENEGFRGPTREVT